MANDFHISGYKNFCHWFRCQSEEEYEHAMKICDFIRNCFEKPNLAAITAPPQSWQNPLQAIETANNHEKYITKRINNLIDLCNKEKHYGAGNFFMEFAFEQIEEEKKINEIHLMIQKVSSPEGYLNIDKILPIRCER
jgi:ferritin